MTITHNLFYKTQPCLVNMAEMKGTFGAVLEVHASECTSPIHVWLSSALHFYHNYKNMVVVQEIMSDRYTGTSMDNSLHAVVLTSSSSSRAEARYTSSIPVRLTSKYSDFGGVLMITNQNIRQEPFSVCCFQCT